MAPSHAMVTLPADEIVMTGEPVGPTGSFRSSFAPLRAFHAGACSGTTGTKGTTAAEWPVRHRAAWSGMPLSPFRLLGAKCCYTCSWRSFWL